MEVGAVADVLENVITLGEWRLTNPVGALAAHLREALGGAVHPLRHVMAADAGIGPHAVRHHGRGVVRAAGAEIRCALKRFGLLWPIAGELLQLGQLGFQGLTADILPDQPLADGNGDIGRLERALGVEQPVIVLVLLADHPRPIGRVEKLLLDLRLDQGALLLDHHDCFEAICEARDAPRLQRPDHADLVEPDAELVRPHLVDAKLIERLPHIEIAFARCDYAELRRRTSAHHEAVELVSAGERQYRGALVVVQALLFREGLVAEPDVEPPGRHPELVLAGDVHHDAIDPSVDGCRALDVILDALQRDPDAGIARERNSQHAIVQDLLDSGRVEHRNHRVHHRELGLVRRGGAFASVIVAEESQHAPVL